MSYCHENELAHHSRAYKSDTEGPVIKYKGGGGGGGGWAIKIEGGSLVLNTLKRVGQGKNALH